MWTRCGQVPIDLDLAYVVIVYLAPDQPSALHQILATCTKMPVVQVDDSPTLKPKCVYVIPPNRQLVIDGDNITLRPFEEPRGQRAPIDYFFRSVAAGRGDGMALILTGAGSDGSNGIKAIKEAGGVVFVQEPAEAQFPSMPQSAIATGVADFIAPISRLVERIGEVAKSKEAVRSLDMDGAANDLRRIITFLRVRTGHDFSSYKRATVMRRVLRRMQVCRVTNLVDYADLLQDTPDEVRKLFADLLISVTMFFRDERPFEQLQHQAIEPLFDEIGEDGIRAWVVGCATGEEAYSIAILILEEAERRALHVPVQIFASDLDEKALATGREGRYPRSIETSVSKERLDRFFVDEGTHYRVRKEVRDTILFTPHSILKDPPFTRLDLVSCRNLLIYLERSLQAQVYSVFHYSLKPGRILFLGSAETVDTGSDLFSPIDRDARIYRSQPLTAYTLPIIPQLPALSRNLAAVPLTAWLGADRPGRPAEIHAAALEQVSPPSILVDEAQNIIHLSPTAGRFILNSAGPLSPRLSSVVRPELRLDLKLALGRAFDTRQSTLTYPVTVDFDGTLRRVATHVAPVLVSDQAPTQALVFFIDGGLIEREEGREIEGEAKPDEMRRLHAELRAAQDVIVSSRNEHEASMQDLRAANEELQSIKEEYRSTSEELETSKEELQSINEELQTVNAELKAKVEDISIAHNDLQNLTASSEIGTLFLDLHLKIRMFTPPVADLINITSADAGRPITDFTHRFAYEGLERDVRQVLYDLVPMEKEIRDRNASWFLMRVRPYLTVDNKVEGAVVTFDDITARKHDEAALRESEARHRLLIGSWSQAVWETDAMGVVTDDSPSWRAHTGQTLDEWLGDGWLDAVHPDDRPYAERQWRESIAAHRLVDSEFRLRARDGGWRWTNVRAAPVVDAEGTIGKWVGMNIDIDARKRVESELREREEQQAFLLRLSDHLRAEPDADAIARRALLSLLNHLRLDRSYVGVYRLREDLADFPYQVAVEGLPPIPTQVRLSDFPVSLRVATDQTLVIEDALSAEGLSELDRASIVGLGFRAFVAASLHHGERQPLWAVVAVSTEPRRWTRNEIALIEAVSERTWAAMERARAETKLRGSEARLELTLQATDLAAYEWDVLSDRLIVNERFKDMIWMGSEEPITGAEVMQRRVHPDDRARIDPLLAHAMNPASDGKFVFEHRLNQTVALGEQWVLSHGQVYFSENNGERRPVRVIGTFQDVTERKRAEQALRESEERQHFLLALGDAMRAETTVASKIEAAMHRLGKQLGTSRAVYGEYDLGRMRSWVFDGWSANDTPSMAGEFDLERFKGKVLDELAAGRIVRINDVGLHLDEVEFAAYAKHGVQALLSVPLQVEGTLKVNVTLHQGESRHWDDNDIVLVQEVAERLWAEVVRARTEAALRMSEQRFGEFGENSSDALWILDLERNQLEYLSPAYERIWGESRDAVLADLGRWAALAHPDDRASASQALPRLRQGEAFVTEYRIVRPDGETRWIRDAGFPIISDGMIKRGGGIAQDITELKRTEAALQQSEARLRQFGEASQDILWIRDAETLQWQYLTPAFEKIYGLSRAEALAGDNLRNWLDLIVPEDRPHAMENIRRVQAGEQVAFEYRIRRPVDGAVRWLRNTDFPIVDEAGKVALIGGIGHDFTEFRKTELRLQTLIEGVPQLVWRAGKPGLWTWASPQWTQYTGQSEEDSHAWGWLEPLHPDDRELARDAWSHAVEQGKFDVEYRIGARDGGPYRWFQTRAAPVRDHNGDIIEWLGTSTDINELRELQARQDVLVAELQHRTRNLITVVKSISQRTIGEAGSLEEFRSVYNDRLAALSRVQGLLSHLSAGQRVSFDDLLGSELDALGAPREKVTLDGPTGVQLRSATVQTFSLALHELATNALKYGALATLEGHLTVRWTVHEINPGQQRLRVEWRESGVEMSFVGERPQGGGYGRELIERALPYQLDARTSYELTPTGVYCTIDVPIGTAESTNGPSFDQAPAARQAHPRG